MHNDPDTRYGMRLSTFKRSCSGAIFLASMIGSAIVVAPFITGRSFAFSVIFLMASAVMTLLWRNSPRPWISLTSISAATPIAISKQQFPCNLIFAGWWVLFNTRYLFQLPRWIYLPSLLAMLGIMTSSINWMSDDFVRSVMRQGAYAINFFLGPFLLLPVVYLKMKESRDHNANVRGLLFFLITPSTVILIVTKLFGTVANAWEASMHAAMLSEGFYLYRIGHVYVNFLRTEVGFVLAALVCASAAIAVSQVRGSYRVWAIACLVINVLLLFSTGSFGSGAACFLGLIAIFYTQLRKVSVAKVIVSFVVICLTLILSYFFAPQNTKHYLEQRFEHRVVNADTDRIALWGRALDAFMDHPEGVGLTLSVGKSITTYIHNDYLTYAVSYGFFGGVAYVSLIVGVLLSFFRARRGVGNDPAALAVYLAGLGVAVALAANAMTDHSNENRWYFNVIWSIIWYCYFCSRPVARRSILFDRGISG